MHCFPLEVREFENPRWQIQDSHHQSKSYDERHQEQASCKVWSLYLESKSKDIRKTCFCIQLAYISINLVIEEPETWEDGIGKFEPHRILIILPKISAK